MESIPMSIASDLVTVWEGISEGSVPSLESTIWQRDSLVPGLETSFVILSDGDTIIIQTRTENVGRTSSPVTTMYFASRYGWTPIEDIQIEDGDRISLVLGNITAVELTVN